MGDMGKGHSTNGMDEMMIMGSLYDQGLLGIYSLELVKLFNEPQVFESYLHMEVLTQVPATGSLNCSFASISRKHVMR